VKNTSARGGKKRKRGAQGWDDERSVEAGEALGGWTAWIHRDGQGHHHHHPRPRDVEVVSDDDSDSDVGRQPISLQPYRPGTGGNWDDAAMETTERDGREKWSPLGMFVVWEVAGEEDFHA
jgi:hypothetical protein